jgi:geranylgeranyl diphosphate synthase, type I
MKQILSEHHQSLGKFLESYLDSKSENFSRVNNWGPDLISKFKGFALNGKLVRGCLVLAFAKMFSKNGFDEENALKAAAAIELAHSSLLIHDDIIDRDDLRRGSPSMHFQCEEYANEHEFNNCRHFGLSLAICAGDIGFFMANELLSTINIPENNKSRLIKLFSSELCSVGLAEMQDIHFEYIKENVAEDDIINMYNYKTARYTFSLPMMMGAIIAESDVETVAKLAALGENLGVIFQIKDDYLGIFGDEKTLGKSVGIDIRDRKKTLYYTLLISSSKEDEDELNILNNIFGKSDITEKDIRTVRKMIIDKGIKDNISSRINFLESKALRLIDALDIGDDSKKILRNILKYNLERTF